MRVVVLSSGSKGNSTYVETKNNKILIDIGTSCIYVERALRKIGVEPKEINAILITHAHVDHISGLRVFAKKYHPVVYVSKETLEESKLILNDINEEDIIDLNDTIIQAIKLSHDTNDIRGYIVKDSNSSMVYITDTGYINEKYLNLLKNQNLYVFESNHDENMLMNNPKYPHHTKIRILSDRGHLSNNDAAYYLSKIVGTSTKYIVLAHLSEQNNTEQLALNTLEEKFKKRDIDISNIFIARQNEPSNIFEI